jgi:hypothetical protein
MIPFHVVVHTTHAVSTTGHGGNKRLAQVVDVLETAASSLRVVQDAFGGSARYNLAAIARGMLPSRTGPTARFRSLRALRNFGVARSIIEDSDDPSSTVFVFDTMMRAVGATFRGLRARGAKLVLFPQNFDSLTPGVVDPMSSRVAPDWFESEIEVLRQADLVCCLSREDQWLLSLHDIPATYLPYYPTAPLKEGLLATRIARETSEKDIVLILGTASNTPTFDGMLRLLRRSEELVKAAGNLDAVVIGYGTEALKATVGSARVRVLGGVAPEILEHYLRRARVCICCQTGTTGALTRIPELLCAGVPILATYGAARSYYHLPGVHVAESQDELFEMLRTLEFGAFPVPPPPTEQERRLVRQVRDLWSDRAERWR